MTDRAMRLCLILAAVPMIYSLAVIAGHASDRSGIDPNRAAGTAGVIVMAAVTIWVWRRYVSWSTLRGLSTAALTGLLLAQALIWKPILTPTDCSLQIMLTHGQNGTAAGLWCIACGLLWWNGVFVAHGRRKPHGGSRIMSPEAVRMALSLALIPLLPGMFFVSMVVARELFGMSDEAASWIGYQFSAVTAVTLWIATWRKRVAWTRRKKVWTGILLLLMLASPAAVFLADAVAKSPYAFNQEVVATTLLLLPLFALAAWFAGTARLWRETGAKLTDADAGSLENALRCPQCDYSLMGLRESRCPECGWTTTVDDLVRRGVAGLTEQAAGSL